MTVWTLEPPEVVGVASPVEVELELELDSVSGASPAPASKSSWKQPPRETAKIDMSIGNRIVRLLA